MFRAILNTAYPNARRVCITAESDETQRRPKQLIAIFIGSDTLRTTQPFISLLCVLMSLSVRVKGR